MTLIAGIECDRPLSVAGSNTARLPMAIRVACTTDGWNQKVRHAVLKVLSDPHGQRSNQLYKTSPVLMAALATYAAEHNYPDPEGDGTNRVPIRLLSNDPDGIVDMRRICRTAEPVLCECSDWRLKTASERKADDLPDQDGDEWDRERYFIGEATRHDYREETRTAKGKSWTVHIKTGTRHVACNPYTCPFATGKDPKTGADRPVSCKPQTTIQFALGDWAGGQLAFVHAESWSTATRVKTSLALLAQQCGGNLAGLECDLVLDYTKPQSVPGGGKTRQPYWSVAIPYGMTETEFRRRAIQNAENLLADHVRLAELAAAQQALMTEGRMPIRDRALLPEFRPGLLPAHDIDLPESGDVDRDAVRRLVDDYGYDAASAEAMVRANAEDLPGLFDRLGDPEHEDAPALEGSLIPDDTPSAVPEPDPTPVPPLFDTPPETCHEIIQRLEALGVKQTLREFLIAHTWDAVSGITKTVVPSPATADSPEQEHALFKDMLARVTRWWDKSGSREYQPQPDLFAGGESQ